MTTVGVVITAFDQGDTIAEAVASVLAQTRRPERVIVVDDGSTDAASSDVLDRLPAGVRVIRRTNGGVAAARNTGLAALDTGLAAVLDGDDAWEPDFLAATVPLLEEPATVAASSWLQMFGVATAEVRPGGGPVTNFLAHNACPASAVFRVRDWASAGGYAESMIHGFEDWDFFLELLRAEGSEVAVVPRPLIRYRTRPASLNVRSMEHRQERFAEIIAHHRDTYLGHLEEALLGLEETSIRRLAAWEELVAADPSLDPGEPSYGDGGMAAAVRIATRRRESLPAFLT